MRTSVLMPHVIWHVVTEAAVRYPLVQLAGMI